MYLYLIRNDGTSLVFHDIGLVGGYLPYIGDGNGPVSDESKSIASLLEPAIWFKAAIIDHVTVDCSQKVLKWSMQTLDQDIFTVLLNNSTLRVTRSLYLENEYDNLECQMDALLEAGNKVAESLSANSRDWHKLLLMFLTEYVLPEIKISREDEDIVQAAMQRQIQLISKIDGDIDARAVKTNRLKQTLRDFRLPIVEDFYVTNGRLKKSRPELFEAVSSHLQRDIAEAENSLTAAANQRAATPDASSASSNAVAPANAANEQRAHLEELRSAYEKLTSSNRAGILLSGKNVMTSQSFLRDRKPIHDLYLASTQVLETLRRETAELLRNKIAAMSVKEAMRSVLQDLRCVEETSGFEIEMGTGRQATDIRQSAIAKPTMAFTSIVERVRSILNNKEHPAQTAHEMFCAQTIDSCTRALAAHTSATAFSRPDEAASGRADSAPFAAAVPHASGRDAGARNDRHVIEENLGPTGSSTALQQTVTLSGGTDGGGSHCAGDRRGCDSDGFVQIARPSLKDICEELRVSAARHCTAIANLIQLDSAGGTTGVNDTPATSQRKRLCYEYYLYERIGTHLLSLFNAVHGDESRLFADELGQLTACDLQLTDPWQVRVLADARRRRGYDDGACQSQLEQQQPATRAASRLHAGGKPQRNGLEGVVACPGAEPLSGAPQSDGGRVKEEVTAAAIDCGISASRAGVSSVSERLRGLALSGDSDSCDGGSCSPEDGDATSSPSDASRTNVPSSVRLRRGGAGRSRRGTHRSGGGTAIAGDVCGTPSLCDVWQRDILAPAVECLGKMAEQPSPLGKLQLLTRCLRVVASGEGKLRHCQLTESSPSQPSPLLNSSAALAAAVSEAAVVRPPSTCSDDLIAATTLLLLCADASLVRSVCVQLKFIEAFINDGLQSGVHAFSLATCAAAVWHLHDLALLKRRSRQGSSVAATVPAAATAAAASRPILDP